MMVDDLKKVYEKLNDHISKKLFMARLEYFVSGDPKCITMLDNEYRSLSSDIEMFRKVLLSGDFDKTVIFGAGDIGTSLALLFPKKIDAFIDNFRYGKTEPDTGLPILSLDEYLISSDHAKDHTRFIISVVDSKIEHTIRRQLQQAGIKNSAVIGLNGAYRNNTSQYFDVLVPGEHESFVDCGCYDGSTSFRFAGWCGKNGYEKIWCFEPDHGSYESCKKNLKNLGRCEVFPYAISEKEEDVAFLATGMEGARIMEDGIVDKENAVKAIALDEFLKNEKVTFIKMDIEGLEMKAIKGASKIIKEQKPRLAICIYHKPDDFVSIPELLLELRPDYQFCIRQYSLLLNETILYAF